MNETLYRLYRDRNYTKGLQTGINCSSLLVFKHIERIDPWAPNSFPRATRRGCALFTRPQVATYSAVNAVMTCALGRIYRIVYCRGFRSADELEGSYIGTHMDLFVPRGLLPTQKCGVPMSFRRILLPFKSRKRTHFI